MGIVGVHPAVFRKTAEAVDCKRVVKHSLCKERKERAKSETGEESFDSSAVGGLGTDALRWVSG